MLTQLTVHNYGLIDQLSVEFHEKLNILSGETGAGKSIVVGALRAALGDKMDVSQLREADQPSVIEAVFDCGKNDLCWCEQLQEFMDADDSTLVIHRTLTPQGRHKIKVNGQAVNIGQLKAIGNRLMDFHGPHDHQMLLNSDYHIELLDQLCDFDESMKQYRQAYKRYLEIKKKIDDLSQMARTRDRELDLLIHQITDLSQVELDEEVYQDILQQKIRVDNAQRLNEAVRNILDLMDEGECSSGELIRQCFSAMNQLNRLDEQCSTFGDELTQIQESHGLLVANLRDYAMSLQFNEQDAQDIHAKSDIYEDIIRKYGPTLDDAKKFYAEAKEKQALLDDLEHNDQELRVQMEKINLELEGFAEKISHLRKKRARALKKTIEKELKELGIAHVRFEAKITKKEFEENGRDAVEFYISPNAGEDLKPMAEIVSSGEAARVMLALKKALIEVDPIPVLVFDEIDAQIGGRLGTITGEKLRDIAQYRQVILITHLPQIASFGDRHHKVIKSVKDSRSITEVIQLDEKQRIVELAQMMSGENESKLSVQHAKDMLKVASR